MSLTNTQYDEIMRSYQERQLRRRHIIAARKDEAARACPRIAQIDAQIAQISVEKARRMLGGTETGGYGADDTDPGGYGSAESKSMNQDSPDAKSEDLGSPDAKSEDLGSPDAKSNGSLEDLKAAVQELARERTELMAAHGFPADYFDPPYDCPHCQDTGYIGNEKCRCFKQASIDLVYSQSNLGSVLEYENFDNFSLKYYSDDAVLKNTAVTSMAAAKNAYSKCRRFVRDFDSSSENIFLFGDTGIGKTFLSHCIAKELLDSGHSVIYFSAHRLFDILADHTFRRDKGEAFDTQLIYDCDLLIIDDLGTEMTNSFTSSQFFVCLNERLLHNRSTLISSNLGLQDIASIYSERVFSRITSDFTLLHLFGKDIRVLKKVVSAY